MFVTQMSLVSLKKESLEFCIGACALRNVLGTGLCRFFPLWMNSACVCSLNTVQRENVPHSLRAASASPQCVCVCVNICYNFSPTRSGSTQSYFRPLFLSGPHPLPLSLPPTLLLCLSPSPPLCSTSAVRAQCSVSAPHRHMRARMDTFLRLHQVCFLISIFIGINNIA